MNEKFTGITPDNKLQTIEIDHYIQQEDNRYIAKLAGQLTFGEVFEKLKAHLEYVGMLPDEYFNLSPELNPDEHIPKDWQIFRVNTEYGASEGIYIHIGLEADHGNVSFATGKTLDESTEDYVRMSRIAAECNMMLNGDGAFYKLPNDIRDYLESKRTELSDTETKLVHSGLVNGESDEVHDKSAELKREIEHHNELEDEDLVEDDQWDL